MPDRLACEKHESSEPRFACIHIVNGLRENRTYGFFWYCTNGVADDARCRECEEKSIRMSDEEWADYAADHFVVLCSGCFREAAEVNGVEIP
jgi:hypothetical protein